MYNIHDYSVFYNNVVLARKKHKLVEKVSGTRFLVLCVCFVDRYLSFCLFSFGHCVVYSSSIYGFELPL